MLKDNLITIQNKIRALESRLNGLDAERKQIAYELNRAQSEFARLASLSTPSPDIKQAHTLSEKMAIFRTLFRGRDDVYPKLWMSSKSGKKGYSPVCENEWIREVCRKPAVKCSACENRKFAPLTDKAVQSHLEGKTTIGVYPLLPDETCHFLAMDFDKHSWLADAQAFLQTCRQNGVPASLERSRSGNGAHIWVFFSEPVPAYLARKMGSFLITETMSQRHELDMQSYDRLFPNQDTMPKGGFGNLIALPLQKEPADKGNAVFLNEEMTVYSDQWAYLSGVRKLSLNEVRDFMREVERTKEIMGIPVSPMEEEDAPWNRSASEGKVHKKLNCTLPEAIDIVLSDKVYILKDGLPSQLLNQMKRVSSFQNPEFYKRQGLRLSTALTPRIITCAESIENYLAMPRGSIDDLMKICSVNNIEVRIKDLRSEGSKIEVSFQGDLTGEQEKALDKMLQYDMGIFVAPPGLGKTVVGIRLIAARETNTLILTHRKPLLEQWRAQIAAFLGMEQKEVGQIGGSKDKATNRIDVAMLQSLERKGKIDDRIKNYGHIIVDECHHISAFSFESVMKEAKAKYITGLTATPYRRDGHQPIITMQCGPIRYTATNQNSTEPSIRNILIPRHTEFKGIWSDEDKIYDLWPQLIADEKRNDMIVNDIIVALQEKRSPIVLTERKEHLEALKQKLENTVEHVIVLHGGMRAKARREMLAKLAEIPDSEGRLVLATGQYIGEGFDDPRLDTLFISMPFSFKGKMVQYAGRLHRSYPGKKEVRIFDYIDMNIPVLLRMYNKRLKGYKLLGYEEKKMFELDIFQ